MKVASFCFKLLFFLFPYVVWFARYRALKFKMSFFCIKRSNSAKKILQSKLKNEFKAFV